MSRKVLVPVLLTVIITALAVVAAVIVSGKFWPEDGEKGDTGNGIVKIELTEQSGDVDTYTITYDDGSTSTYSIVNGHDPIITIGENGNWFIDDVDTGRASRNTVTDFRKTSTNGLVDTYTITYVDGTTYLFNVTNGAKGDTGNGISSIQKTTSNGLEDTYKISYTNGSSTFFTVTNGEKGDKGDTGVSITGVSLQNTTGLENTYKISFSDDTTTTFKVTNAKSITGIAKTSTSGLVDTYTISYNDGTSTTFTVANAKSIVSVAKTLTNGLEDTYTITFNDGTSTTFKVTNGHSPVVSIGTTDKHWYIDGVDTNVVAEGKDGVSITSVSKTSSEGLVDTYTITYSVGDPTTFTVTNAKSITGISKTSTSGLVDTYTITYNVGDPTTFTVTNGAKGDAGTNGSDGNGIASIAYASTNGLVDTYTVTYTDTTTSEIKVTNGKSITGISKTSTNGLVDTYTITYNVGDATTFTVANAKSITNVEKTGTNNLVDTYTITYNDQTTSTFTVTNGHSPAVTIGETDKHWYIDGVDTNVVALGQDGVSITGVSKTSSEGLVDTYTITYSVGDPTTFTVANGNGISSIAKTGTNELVDTYTITYTNGTSTTFTVTNGAKGDKGDTGTGISGIALTNTTGLVDTYTVTFTDNNTATFTVTNGKSITSVSKTSTSGLVDTYTITYNVGDPTTFTVTNAKSIVSIAKTGTNGLVDTYTITYNDQTTSTYTVTNGADGHNPVITIGQNGNWFVDGVDTETKAQGDTGETGKGISSIAMTAGVACNTDRITVTFSDNTQTQFDVTNPSSGHTYGAWTIIVLPTETEPGFKYRTCSVCSKNEVELIAPDHLHTYEEHVIPATCQTKGYTIHICPDDGYTYTSDYTATIPHNFVEGKCTMCGYELNAANYLFALRDDDTYTVTAYSGTSSCIIVPGEYNGKPVTALRRNFLKNNETVTDVILSENITTIGEYAFQNCRKLQNITLPASIQTIETSAFSGCGALRSVNYLGDIASWCSITFNNNPLTLAHDLYIENVLQTDIVIPSSVTAIKMSAFSGWHGNSITIGENVASIADHAFNNCTATIIWPVCPAGTVIAPSSFYEYRGTSIVLPDGVVSIGEKAFASSENLKTVFIPGSVTTIGNSAFEQDVNLTNLTLSEGLISIGNKAFRNCYGLTDIVVPSTVTSIGTDAFENCFKLIEVYNKSSLSILADTTAYGNIAFYAQHVYTEGDSMVTTVGDFKYFGEGNLIAYTGTADHIYIPATVNKVSEYAFYGSNLRSIEFLGDNTVIESYAFGSSYYLHSVVLPSNLDKIKAYTFQDCYGLYTLTIPSTVTEIAPNAFKNCYKLIEIYNRSSLTITAGATDNGFVAQYAKNVYTDAVETKLFTNAGGYVYYVDGFEKILVAYIGNEVDLIVDNDVTKIYQWAFYNDDIRQIELPDTLTSLGGFSFYRCSDLTYVVFGGDRAQWLAVNKENNWNQYTGEYTVHCVDADVAK